jgi:thiamine kinase-like enzyme
MTFLLKSQNVFDYLVKHGFCEPADKALSKVEPVAAKNFNLLITFPNNRKILVKQERYNQQGKAVGEFLHEWRIQELLNQFPDLEYLHSSLPEVVHFDQNNLIIIFNYLDDYQDLSRFYTKEKCFSIEIAEAIGTRLASIHRNTFKHQEYQDFLTQNFDKVSNEYVHKLSESLERVGPEIFGMVPADGLRFFALYQRYDSLGEAITKLVRGFTPSCLTHNDLKLNNILLHKDWQQSGEDMIRLIDWERSTWGDPAFDLGTLISSYVQIWLGSLVISKSLSIDESLRLAIIPLERLQPSIAKLTQAYLHNFPEILEHYPDFLERVVQFVGFALIQSIQAMIQYQKSFGNTGIAMLQVAKTLLCRPEQSMPTIFGNVAELTRFHAFAV